ncbi:hypothetical protein GCM10025868_04890 [Angustibacter aerolatus]|uniref:DNA ligase (ATP) n=1 Tax=Angustibacter aerolatus TaxID=1162965 RepID=A0ABQ6JCS2_9ACTN|nr:hypothetical protein [Angustibacter aerolatus]GMA85239.1 hypothetical protein GCM10025868_04890 [Angustibacter aerolatus]
MALGDDDLRGLPFEQRRAMLEQALAHAAPPVHVTPATRDVEEAAQWFERFEGAGLDGVISKKLDLRYQPDKRVMTKIKHVRSADCVVAGYRVHKSGPDAIGSLLLGLYDEEGHLASVGVIGAFTMARRREPVRRACSRWSPTSTTTRGPGPGRRRASARRARARAAGGTAARTSRSPRCGPSLVVEVKYDAMEGVRFRHTAQFLRWRPDREPAACTYEQARPAGALPRHRRAVRRLTPLCQDRHGLDTPYHQEHPWQTSSSC